MSLSFSVARLHKSKKTEAEFIDPAVKSSSGIWILPQPPNRHARCRIIGREGNEFGNVHEFSMPVLSYTFPMPDPKDNYRLYMENAREMLEVAEENLGNERYSTACNRAYYAIFYAASALLYSKGKTYGKHSAVLAAFRQFFIKTGEFEKQWSDDYRFIMESRHTADYNLYNHLEKEEVVEVVAKAQAFVEKVNQWLRKHDLL